MSLYFMAAAEVLGAVVNEDAKVRVSNDHG
jgi:hypothetical protein